MRRMNLLDEWSSPSKFFSLRLQAEKCLKRRLLDLSMSLRRRRSEESESRKRRVCDAEKGAPSVSRMVLRCLESLERTHSTSKGSQQANLPTTRSSCSGARTSPIQHSIPLLEPRRDLRPRRAASGLEARWGCGSSRGSRGGRLGARDWEFERNPRRRREL